MATGFALVYPKFRAFTSITNVPLSGGKLYSYIVGTTTPKALFTDANITIPAANPVILDSNGEATLYGNGAYDLKLTSSTDVLIWTESNVFFSILTSVAPTPATSQWLDQADVATFIDTASFSVPTDLTLTYTPQRRIKIVLASKTIYGVIVSSAFTSVTTVVCSFDGTDVLDNTLTTLSLGILTPTKTGLPSLTSSQWCPQIGPYTRTADTIFTVTGDQTSTYVANMLIRAKTSPGVYVYGRIVSAVFTSLTTITVAWISGVISANPLEIALNIFFPYYFTNTNPIFPSPIEVDQSSADDEYYILKNTGQTMRGRLIMDSAGSAGFTNNWKKDDAEDDTTKPGVAFILRPDDATIAASLKRRASSNGAITNIIDFNHDGSVNILGALTLGTNLSLNEISRTSDSYTAGTTSGIGATPTTIFTQSLGTVNTDSIVLVTIRFDSASGGGSYVAITTSGGVWVTDVKETIFAPNNTTYTYTKTFQLKAASTGATTLTIQAADLSGGSSTISAITVRVNIFKV